MSATDFLDWVFKALIVTIFVVVTIRAVRWPNRLNLDTALLFGAFSLYVVLDLIVDAAGLEEGHILQAIDAALILALPYLLLRLVDDFSNPPRWVVRGAEAGLIAVVVALFVFTPNRPMSITLLMILYFVAVILFAAVGFAREARRAGGVTRRRLQAVGVGSAALGAAIAVAGVALVVPLPVLDLASDLLIRLMAVAALVAYFVGFTPPAFLRRAWQEPELRQFLRRAASLPRLPDVESIVLELEAGAAASTGAPTAAIGLWDQTRELIVYRRSDGEPIEYASDQFIGGRAFTERRAIFSSDVERDDPANAEVYRRFGTRAILAAPISAGEQRLGVLVVYAPQAPIFAEDDLELVQLLADQAAVILESRMLIDEATRVQAREAATRLKDDFLSAAAHDLKTPLTTLLAQAQLLERQAMRAPDQPADIERIRILISETKRLSTLVTELLDASRVEQGRLVGAREPVDLVAIARDACHRHGTDAQPCVLEADGPVIGQYDRVRVMQLLDNLIQNAQKYSRGDDEVRVRVFTSGSDARLEVIDHGIGIPPHDVPHLFERFFRASNVDDRRFAGMGLGLFICRGIAEQHGGRIWVTSEVGKGSTFHVALPLGVPDGAQVPAGGDGVTRAQTVAGSAVAGRDNGAGAGTDGAAATDGAAETDGAARREVRSRE